MTSNEQIEAAVRQRQAARLVEREVHACLSSLVAALAQGVGRPRKTGHDQLIDLSEQAQKLSAPTLDYESAAREAGWCEVTKQDEADTRAAQCATFRNGSLFHTAKGLDWKSLCDMYGIEPYEIEVYEHWAVSTWLAEKLIASGERVDTDLAGLNVWARTTTGQAISLDSVIERIVADTGYASAV